MSKIHYTGWKGSLNKYHVEMAKELAAVRKAKQELYELQRQLQEMMFAGRYERDEDTLILSAPNIIIGNVDKQGNLLMGSSKVTIRSNEIALEGVGQSDGTTVTGGTIVNRARTVKVQTVDPGPDGLESVAFSDSAFTVQSAAVSVVAEKIDPVKKSDGTTTTAEGGVFTISAKKEEGSINLTAENNVTALAACALASQHLNEVATQLEGNATNYNNNAETAIKLVDEHAKKLDETLNNKLLSMLGEASDEADTMALRTGLYNFDERSDISMESSLKMAEQIMTSTANMSNEAEAKRISKYLNTRAGRIAGMAESYDTTASKSSINLRSEHIYLSTTGANGKVRKTPGNGVVINSQNTIIKALEGKEPIENSTFSLLTDNVFIDTAKYTYEGENENLQPKTSTAQGNITINSAKVNIQTMDKEFEAKDGKTQVKAAKVSQDSYVKINSNQVNLDMTDSEGKANGSFKVNAEKISLTTYDLKKDDGKPSATAENGEIIVGGKVVSLGSLNDQLECDMIQVSAKDSIILGKEDVYIIQEPGKSQLILNGNAELAGSDVKLVGNINLIGETKIDAKFTAGDIEAKNIKASASITGPNIKDGMPLQGAAPATKASKPAEPKKPELESPKIIEEIPISIDRLFAEGIDYLQ